MANCRPCRCRLDLCLVLAALAATGHAGTAKDRESESFEVRGTLLPPQGIDFHKDRAYVRLDNPVGPPVTSSEADGDGRFRIKRVPTGMYLLTAFVPRVARGRLTIEVGPSLADPKGRVEVTLRMERSLPRPGQYQVTIDQLSIPEEARSEFEKGRRKFGKGDLAGAALQFRRAIDLAPNFGAAWNQLGTIEYSNGNYREAAAHYREATKHLPGNYRLFVTLGAALLAAQDGKAALSVNSRAVEERPTDAQAHAQLGFTLCMLDRLDEAEGHLRKAVALDPAHFLFPQLLLAEIYRRRNDYASMSRELEEFVRLHPDSPKTREVRPILQEVRSRMSAAGRSTP